MKITNLSDKSLYLADLRFTPQAQEEGRRGEDQSIAPAGTVVNGLPTDRVYLPNTAQVTRSVYKGTLKRWSDDGVLRLEDWITLGIGGSATLTHNFGIPQKVLAQKFTGTLTTEVVTVGNRQTVDVTFAALPDANYLVQLTMAPTGPTGYVTNKTTTGFTLNLSRIYTGDVTCNIYQGNWEDAMGSFDAAQNAAFTSVVFTNTSGVQMTFIVSLT